MEVSHRAQIRPHWKGQHRFEQGKVPDFERIPQKNTGKEQYMPTMKTWREPGCLPYGPLSKTDALLYCTKFHKKR